MTCGRIAAVGAQVFRVVLRPRVFAHLDEGTGAHVEVLGGYSTPVASVVGTLQQPCQSGRLLRANGVETQTLRHHRLHDVLFPWRLYVGLRATRRVALRLAPLPLHHVVDEVHAGGVGGSRQEVAGVGHFIAFDVHGVQTCQHEAWTKRSTAGRECRGTGGYQHEG